MESEELLRHGISFAGLFIMPGDKRWRESILTGRPTFDSTTVWTRTKLNYPPQSLLPAWDLFIRASGGQAQKEPGKGLNEERSKGQHPITEGFLFDLTDITRQYWLTMPFPCKKNGGAFHAGTVWGSETIAAVIELISDMDLLLSTRTDFLLGLDRFGQELGNTPAEKQLYEMNAAPDYVMGDANSPLHEYANRQWSGLLNDFYKVRWQKFFSLLESSWKGNGAGPGRLRKEIRGWEWDW